VTTLTAASLVAGIAAVFGAGLWRCARLLFRIAVAVERVPELATAVQKLDHRTTRIEAEIGIT
jgi:hypothetical protein